MKGQVCQSIQVLRDLPVPPLRSVLGLTGNPGAGKTMVAEYCRHMGATVIHADKIGHQLLKNDIHVQASLLQTFGNEIRTPAGEIDRKALGKIVFSQPDRLQQLNELIHPTLVERIHQQIQEFRDSNRSGPMIVDAALLYEWKIDDVFDAVLVVAANKQIRCQRFVANRNRSEELFYQIEASQLDESIKIQKASHVFYNDKDETHLFAQVEQFIKG
jgi:dephospho-CoA kinase